MAENIRKVTKLQDFADVLTSVGGGWRTTFVYLNAVKFRKTGQAIDMDKLSSSLDSDIEQGVSDKFNNFIAGGNKRNNRFPFAGVLKVAKYTLNWQTARKYRENYNDFVTKSDDIAAKYAAMALKRQGLPLTQDALDSVQIKSRKQRDYEKQEIDGKERKPRKDDKRFVDYGEGGMYVRTNDFNKKGENRVVIPQNFKNLTFGGRHFYLINDDGSIAGGKPISEATIEQIITKNGNDKSKANALRKLGANEEEIKQYLEEFDKLGWFEYDFLADSFLYVVASSTDDYHNGKPEKIIFFNEELVDEFVSKDYNFKINPSDFMTIARNEIKTTYGITLESKRYINNNIKYLIKESYNKKKKLRIFENYIKKTVRSILNEGRWSRGYVPHDGNSMVGGYYGHCEGQGTCDILSKYEDAILVAVDNTSFEDDEYSRFIEYLYDNEDCFDIYATFSGDYDESTNYGSAYAPMWSLLDIDSSDAENCVKNYPTENKEFIEFALEILDDVINSLDEDDFNIEEDEW